MSKKTTNELLLADEVLINKIYLIKGQKVMLDRDLAELFGTIPIRLREQVKRNIDRFPKNFMFQLTEKRNSNHGIAKCDTFQTTFRRFVTLGIYRTWSFDAGKCFEK